MIISVKSHVLAAVQALCAGEDEVRYCLRGWYLDTSDPERAWIVGSNGHAMLAAPVATVDGTDKPAQMESIFRPVKVHKTREPHEVLIDTSARVATARDKQHPLETITGTFPDWKKLLGDIEKKAGGDIEKKAGGGHPQCYMGVDVQILAPVARALSPHGKRATCRLVFGPKSTDGIVVKWGGSFEAHEIRCAWMPCHL